MSMYKKGRGARKVDADKEDDKVGKVSSAVLRLTKDFSDLDIPAKLAKLVREEKDPMNFSFIITPDTGYWKGGVFEFTFAVPNDYPFKEPKVKCIDKIYHPNIHYEGAVCVNVLRPWKSIYTIQMVLLALLFLFAEPNPMDVLEKEPAEVMRKDAAQFARNAILAMKGNSVGGVSFPKNRGNIK